MYLGVDGGGSKTEFLLIDDEGNTVARHLAGGSYHPDIGLAGVEAILEDSLRDIAKTAGISIDGIRYAVLGLPAYGEDSSVDPLLQALPARWFPDRNYSCVNDMVCAWAGSLDCADGIALIAGTGSIGYGVYEGRVARAGGWGELFGDEGSAYWIGAQGLRLFSQMSDGRRERGLLYEFFRDEFKLHNDLDLSSHIINRWAGDRGRIAGLSPIVARAATGGDDEALQIFATAAAELAAIVTAIARQLSVPGGVVLPVSCSGGVFRSGELILKPFRTCLAQAGDPAELRHPVHSAAMGAARLARRLAEAVHVAKPDCHQGETR